MVFEIQFQVVEASVERGVLSAFLPQAIDDKSQPPSLAFLEAQSVLRVVSGDRITQDELQLWWFAPGCTDVKDQFALSIQGYAIIEGVSRLHPGDTETINLCYMNGDVTNSVILKVTAVSGRCPLHGGDMMEVARNATQRVVNVTEEFYRVTEQVIPHVNAWTTGGVFTPAGMIPTWGFVLEYAFPQHTQSDIACLLRLLQFSLHRMSIEIELRNTPRRWNDSLKAELWSDMSTALALVGAYRLDREELCYPQRLAKHPTVRIAHEKNSMPQLCNRSNDQWFHPLAFSPMLSEMGTDCEDEASIIFRVARAVQTLPSPSTWRIPPDAPDELVDGLIQIHQHSQLYHLFFTVGTLRLDDHADSVPVSTTYRERRAQQHRGDGSLAEPGYTYHAFVTAIDRHDFDSNCACGVIVQPTRSHVPTLFMEGTEYTTSCLEFTSVSDEYKFDRLRIDDCRIHGKIPASVIRRGSQYQTIVSLSAPQLWKTHGACEWAAMFHNPAELDSPATVGLPAAMMRPALDGSCSMIPISRVTAREIEAVKLTLSYLPRSGALPPPCPDNPLSQFEPCQKKHYMYHYTREADWRSDTMRSTIERTLMWRDLSLYENKIELLHGISLIEIVVTPESDRDLNGIRPTLGTKHHNRLIHHNRLNSHPPSASNRRPRHRPIRPLEFQEDAYPFELRQAEEFDDFFSDDLDGKTEEKGQVDSDSDQPTLEELLGIDQDETRYYTLSDVKKTFMPAGSLMNGREEKELYQSPLIADELSSWLDD